MPNNIDRRVVQMEFDNAEFEKRVKTTRETLKNLNSDLKFDSNLSTLNNLNSAIKSIDVSSMSDGIEKVKLSFSSMGAVGFTVMQNLTNTVLGFGKKIYNSTLGQIISGGKRRAFNLEQAQFQLKGLGVDWLDTKTDLGVSLKEQINNAVSGTAYGLDSAAKVAGQLVASSVKAGSKTMEESLNGISGVAAMTNRSYDEIGAIFTKVASTGKLMGEHFNMFAERGLNVAAVLAKYTGKTEAEVKDIKNNPIDYKTFVAAMNQEFAAAAKKANDTFEGARSNVNAALSRIGADVMGPYMENLRQFFVALIPVIDNVRKVAKPAFDIIANGMSWIKDRVVDVLKPFQDLNNSINPLAKAGKKLQAFYDLLYKKNDKSMSAIDYIKSSFYGVINVLTRVKDLINTVLRPLKDAFVTIFRIDGSLLTRAFESIYNFLWGMDKYLSKVVTQFKMAVNKGDALNRVFQGAFAILASIFNITKSILGIFAKIAAKALMLFTKVLSPILSLLLRLVAPVSDIVVLIYDFFFAVEAASTTLKPITDALSKLKNTIGDLATQIKNVFKVTFKPLIKGTKESTDTLQKFKDFLTNTFTKGVNFVSRQINKLNDFIYEHRAKIFDFTVDVIYFLAEAFKKAKSILEKVKEFVGNLDIVGHLKGGWTKAKEFVSSWDGMNSFISSFPKKFEAFKDKISNTVSSFGNIKTDGVTTFIKNFKVSTGPLESVINFFKSFWEMLKSIVAKLMPFIKSIVMTVFDTLRFVADTIKNGFDALDTSTGKSVLAAGGGIAVIMMIVNKLKSLMSDIKSLEPNKFIKSIQNTFDAITKFTKNFNEAKTFKKIATSLLEIAIAVFILASIDENSLAKSLAALIFIGMELAALFKMMQKSNKRIISSASEAIVKMATSVLILAIAMKTLAKLDPSALLAAGVAVSILLYELAGVFRLISTSKDAEKVAIKGGGALIFMAAAVFIMAKALKSVASEKPEGLIAAAIALSALVLMVSNAAVAMSKNQKGVLKASLAMIVMSLAIAKMGSTISKIAEQPVEGIIASGLVLSLIIGMLERLANTKGGDNAKAIAKSLKGLIASFILVALACKLFEKIDDEAMIKAGAALAAVLAAFVVFNLFNKKTEKQVVYQTQAQKKQSNSMKDLALVMLSFAGAVVAVAYACQMISAVSWEDMAKAGITLAVVLGVIVLFSKLKDMKYENLGKVALAMVELAGGLAVFGLALRFYKNLEPEAIAAGLRTLIAVMVTMIITAKLLKDSDVLRLQRLAGAIALFGASVFLMGVGVAAFASAVVVLGASIAALEAFITGMSYILIKAAPLIVEALRVLVEEICNAIIKLLPTLEKTIIATGTSLLRSIVALLPEVSNTLDAFLDAIWPILAKWLPKILDFLIEWTPVIIDKLVDMLIKIIDGLANRAGDLVLSIANFFKKLIGAIAEASGATLDETTMRNMLLGLSVFAACLLVIAFAAKIAQKALVGMAVLLGIVVIITTMFLILSNIDSDAFIKIALGLSAAMTSISVAMAIISVVPFAAALRGMIGFAAVIAILVGILELIGWLANNEGFLENLKRGADAFGLIGKAIGEFVGNLIGEIASAIIDLIPKIAEALSDFMDKLQPFLNGVRSIDASLLESVGILAGVILAFTATDLLAGITSFFTGGIDYSDFGQALVDFAPYLVQFGEAMAGVNTVGMLLAAKAAEAIAEFASKIPNEGGLLAKFIGDNSIGKWGPQLPVLADGLVAFSDALPENGIRVEAIKSAMDAATAIAVMAQKIPNEGGLLAEFMGENSLGVWGPQLPKFAENLVQFDKNLGKKGVRVEAIKSAMDAATAIADMARQIPNEGGMLAEFFGENSLDVWGPQLPKFARNLLSFDRMLGQDGIRYNIVKTAMDAALLIVDLAKEIPSEGGALQWLTGEKSLKTFGQEMYSFGIDVVSFANEMAKITNMNAFSRAVSTIARLIDFSTLLKDFDPNSKLSSFANGMNALANANIEEFTNAFLNADTKTADAAHVFLDAMLDALDDAKSQWQATGLKLINHIIAGMKQRKEAMESDLFSIFTYAQQQANSDEMKNKFKNTGRNLIAGVIEGMYEKKNDILKAAEDVSNGIVNSINITLGINSPAKEGIKIGKFFDMGIANGLTRYSSMVMTASEGVSSTAIDYISGVVDTINNFDFDNIETNPTIQPVMDLSNVNTGIRAISNLMANARTYSIGAGISNDISELSKKGNTITIEATNTDVVKAVGELKSEMQSMREQMARMKLYLDGKTVVGELVDPMDAALGKKVTRKTYGGVINGRLV